MAMDISPAVAVAEVCLVLVALCLPAATFHLGPRWAISTAVASAVCYLGVPFILQAFWSTFLFGVSSCLTMLRLMQVAAAAAFGVASGSADSASAAGAAAADVGWLHRPAWQRVLFLLAMHDIRACHSIDDGSAAADTAAAKSPADKGAPTAALASASFFRAAAAAITARAAAAGKRARGWSRMVWARGSRLLILAAEVVLRFGASLMIYGAIPMLAMPTNAEGRAAGDGTAATAAWWSPMVSLTIRTALAASCMLLWLDCVDAGLSAGYCLFGLRTMGSTQNDPLFAMTVSDFWVHRWNREMHALLKAAVYVPCRRVFRQAAPQRLLSDGACREMAVVGTFAVSGLLHAYVYLLLGHRRNFCSSMLFFLLQPLFMKLERALGVASWRRPAPRRLWTWFALLVAFPLLSEPMLWLLPPDLGWLLRAVRPAAPAAAAARVAAAVAAIGAA